MPGGTDAVNYRSGPLAGIRVIDLSRVIAGPYAGRLLTDLGADVIKVEPPEGDPSREIAPKHDRGMSGFLTFANVGKRSLCIDLRASGAIELLLALIAKSDAVIENFRPGVLERLGLGWKTIHGANPRAVLLSINGFGEASAWADRRAYAPIMHAVTGILADQSRASGHPVAQRNEAHADTVAALHGALGLVSALRVAEATGVGQHVEVPMFDAVLGTYNSLAYELLDRPDDRVMNPIYQAGKNGPIATAGSVQHVWASISRTFSLADPAPRGSDVPTKARLREAALEDWMAAQGDQDALLASLARAGIACAPVVSLRDAATGALAQERDLLVSVDDRRGGTRPVVRQPARFSDAENRVRGPAPLRGEHNAQVLHDVLDYDAERIAALERGGVLIAPEAS